MHERQESGTGVVPRVIFPRKSWGIPGAIYFPRNRCRGCECSNRGRWCLVGQDESYMGGRSRPFDKSGRVEKGEWK